MSVNTLAVFLLGIAAAACQHAHKQPNIGLPAHLRPFFSTCRDQDGVFSGRVFKESQLYFSGELEWISSREADLTVDILNPAGSSEGTLRYGSSTGQISLLTPVNELVDHGLSLDENQYLRYHGYSTPVKIKEIACLLSGQFPLSWVEELKKIERLKSGEFKLHAEEERRSVSLVLSLKKEAQSCASLRWSTFLGLIGHRLEYCVKAQGQHRPVTLNIDQSGLSVGGQALGL